MSNSLQKQNPRQYAINRIRNIKTSQPSLRIKFHKTAVETPNDRSRHDLVTHETQASKILPMVPISPRNILSTRNLHSPRETNMKTQYQKQVDEMRETLRKLRKKYDKMRLCSDQYYDQTQQLKSQMKDNRQKIEQTNNQLGNTHQSILTLQQQLRQITTNIEIQAMQTHVRQYMIDNLKNNNIIHKKNLSTLKLEHQSCQQSNKQIKQQQLKLKRQIQQLVQLAQRENQPVISKRQQQLLHQNHTKIKIRKKIPEVKQHKIKTKAILYTHIMLAAILKSKIRRIQRKGQPLLQYYLKIRSQISHGIQSQQLNNPYELQKIMAAYPQYQQKVGLRIMQMEKYQSDLQITSDKLKEQLLMLQMRGQQYLQSPQKPSIHVEEIEQEKRSNLHLMKLGNWAYYYKNILDSIKSDTDAQLIHRIMFLLSLLSTYRQPSLIEVKSEVSEPMKFKPIMRMGTWSAKSSQEGKRVTILRREQQRSLWRDGLSEKTDLD